MGRNPPPARETLPRLMGTAAKGTPASRGCILSAIPVGGMRLEEKEEPGNIDGDERCGEQDSGDDGPLCRKSIVKRVARRDDRYAA